MHGVAYCYGRAPAGTEVEIAPHGRVQEMQVNEAGWWLYMAETEEPLPLEP